MSQLSAPTFAFAPGKTWYMPVTYLQRNVDGTLGAPVDLTGGVASGILFTRGNLAGLPLTVANGGVTVDPTNGVMNFLVSESVTVGFVADVIAPFSDHHNYPTRLEVDFRDTLGHLGVAGVFPIFVFDPRFVDPSTFPTQQSGTIVSGAEQGLPGPASYKTYRIPVASEGQTLLPWPAGVAPDLTDVGLLVDGREYRAPFITTAATGITWAGPFELEPEDDVLARY